MPSLPVRFLFQQVARLQQVLQCTLVVLQAEFTEPEEGERAAVLRRQAGHALEGGPALGKLLERVIGGALIPVALGEIGAQLDRFGVEGDGVFPPLGIPRFGGGLDDLIELRRRRGRRSR